MATAPFQLLMDLPPIASATRASSTVTVTTTQAHNLTTGAYVEIGNTSGAAGSTMVGVYQVTVTSGTAFTYTAAGSAGTATIGSAFASVDLLNPAENLAAGTARQNAMIADPSSLQLSANGDGSSSTMSLVITQETTPAAGPWFSTVPDNTRFRLVQKDTGSASVLTDRRFVGVLTSLSVDLNGSGQGTTTTLNLSDANWLLERIGVFGQMVSARSIEANKISRSGNVSTITFGPAHGFVVGQTIRVSGALGGSAGTGEGFNGVFKVKTVPNDKTLTYDNAGPTAVSLSEAEINGSVVGGAKDRIQISGRFVDLNIENGTQLGITGFGATGGTNPTGFLRLIRTGYNGSRVINNGANSVILVMPTAHSGNVPTLTGTGRVYVGRPTVSAEGFNGQLVVTIPGGLTEDEAMSRLLTVTNAYSAEDYPLQRFISTSDVTKIVGGTEFINSDAIQFTADSLRSSIETVIETYSGNDAKDRRYYVNLAGQLVYELVDPASKPTYATAPYVVTTDAVAGTPNTTTGKASVAPYDLTVNYDHEITKRAMFTIPSSTGTAVSAIVDFDQALKMGGTAAFSARSGPRLSAIVDYPTVVKDAASRISTAAAAWFLERHKPLLSGQFTLRGAGTASFNQYGFTSGYAQTGTASYSLVNRWEPGQWVEVNSASLGLSGLYRVEQVEWSLEPASYLQTVTVYFNRKNPSDLASLIANNKA
jgi:hypothetical protein